MGQAGDILRPTGRYLYWLTGCNNWLQLTQWGGLAATCFVKQLVF